MWKRKGIVMEILEEHELNKKINNFLIQKLKMKTTIGLSYWIKAISYYTLQKQQDISNLVTMKEIYSLIAKKYDTSISNAEKVMRYAKEKSEYMKFFNIENKLKNHEFLIICASQFLI